MLVVPVPCLNDNYSYLLCDLSQKEAWVVDPSEASPVTSALAQRGLRLTGILLTHHHADHLGGLLDLVACHSGVPVLAHESEVERIPSTIRGMHDGETLATDFGLIEVLHVPGHTTGSVAYHVDGALFTGDTLFGGGCGRLFEGTAAQMYQSLTRLAELPGDTRVYSGHEYTLANLAFAAHLEPDFAPVRERIIRVTAQREQNLPSVPSTLNEELTTNPFLRCQDGALAAKMCGSSNAQPSEVFAEIRRQKDVYRG